MKRLAVEHSWCSEELLASPFEDVLAIVERPCASPPCVHTARDFRTISDRNTDGSRFRRASARARPRRSARARRVKRASASDRGVRPASAIILVVHSPTVPSPDGRRRPMLRPPSPAASDTSSRSGCRVRPRDASPLAREVAEPPPPAPVRGAATVDPGRRRRRHPGRRALLAPSLARARKSNAGSPPASSRGVSTVGKMDREAARQRSASCDLAGLARVAVGAVHVDDRLVFGSIARSALGPRREGEPRGPNWSVER